MFAETSQNSQGTTFARVSFIIKLQDWGVFYEFCEVFKNTFFYRTPLVATSVLVTLGLVLVLLNRKINFLSSTEILTKPKEMY